jgi:hypothetical protein
VDKIATAARDYLHAAIIDYTGDKLEQARLSLGESLRLYPQILERDQPLENLVRAYTPDGPIQAALVYTDLIFRDLFPRTKFLSRMRSRLLSYLHMSQVFAGANHDQPERIKTHLWSGIRDNPIWLLNRGVILILVKSLLRHNSTKKNQQG